MGGKWVGDYEKYWPYLGGHIDTHFLKFPMHPLTGLSPKMVLGGKFSKCSS